jgi:dTDP-4-dehydrorhamnose reductase/SAM-dependent methyltransferase
MSDLITNALIFGGSGMIGTNIIFGNKPSSNDVNILNMKSIQNYVSKIGNISCIINLVALNLRDSEKDTSKSIDVNINGTCNLLSVAKKLNIPFILLSTGAVFSTKINNKQVFTEKTETNPNCVYGCTKSSSEKLALLYEKTIIIRTGWVFGGSQKTHYKFVEQFINNLLTNTTIHANNNFYGSPTYVIDLIEKIKYIINNKIYGIHHVVNSDIACGYDVAVEIANLLGKKCNLITSINCNMVPNAGPERSVSEILESENEFNKMRSWKDALKEYIKVYLYEKNINQTLTLGAEENIIWKNREKCRLCNSTKLQTFFKLQPSPQANHYVKKPICQELIPLDICICNHCNHIQLVQIVDQSFQYSTYLYITSASKTMVNHITSNIESFLQRFVIQKTDHILEIGANDGTGIQYLMDNQYYNSIGIDPASNIQNIHDLPIICDFFGSNILNNEKMKKGSFKLIYAFHCCAHIEDIQDVFVTIYDLLSEDGIFVMEVGYFYEVYKQQLFDTIYHEHIDYHTCKAMQHFCLKNNLTLFDVKTNKIQSGSIQFYISKNKTIDIHQNVFDTILKEESIKLFDIDNLLDWKKTILLNSRDLNYLINSLTREGKTIYGYGASAKSTTFIHQFKLSNNVIKYIIDDSYLKQNLFTPGSNIPIVSIDILNIEKCDYLIILSWNFLDDILLKIQEYRKHGLRVIVPFPNITII